MTEQRLGPPFGLRLDRDAPIPFTFDGVELQGFAGDTIASALLANGVTTLSRSFKYHRPRGVLSHGGQEANTLVSVGAEPNVAADRVLLEPGMAVRSQNVFGSLNRDWASVLGWLGRFLPVGFYYDAFYKPRGAWRLWQGVIRRLAGLGHVDLASPRRDFDKMYRYADVAVIGAGPAGMAAALEAAQAGAEVLLVDEEAGLGGAMAYGRNGAEGESRALVEEVRSCEGLEVMLQATCTGVFEDNWLSVVRGRRLYKVRAKSVVLASGAYEQPMIFRNNDLPGVMMASAAQRLLRFYGVRPGSRAVIATANDHGYCAALDLLDAGIEVVCVVDLRREPLDSAWRSDVTSRPVRVLPGHTVWEAQGCGQVTGAVIGPVEGDGNREPLSCDLIVTSVGYSPVGNLLSHAGGSLSYEEDAGCFAITAVPDGMYPAGAVNGQHGWDSVIGDGVLAGWRAARGAGCETAGDEPKGPAKPGLGVNHSWPIFPHVKGKDFVDFDEDLQVQDIRDTVALGYEGIELVKRFSTVGMGPSQGRHGSVAAARIVAQEMGVGASDIGASTSRPPFRGEKLGVLAGRSFDPVAYTPMHDRHVELGAEMMTAGRWLRPAYYRRGGDREGAIAKEALAVRNNVGLMDVSTLGGLFVRGPDGAAFLERIYCFAYTKQPVGKLRYLLMTDMAGVVVDDGVAARLGDQDFYLTATTAGVDQVYRRMLWHNAQWGMDVDVTNVTSAYSAVNVAGPKSRAVLAAAGVDVDLGGADFPYLGVREGNIGGIPAFFMRVGFVGELGYEIHVPSVHGEALWDLLMEAGEGDGIMPFGVEAQRLLRLEKGHVIIGQDSDGLTTPQEAGLDWAIAGKKPYFVGKRSVEIQARTQSRRLVGFVLKDSTGPRPKEGHLVVRDGGIAGHVTSAAHSQTLDKSIGLAYVAPDQTAPGTEVSIRVDGGAMIEAAVTALPFYDREKKRQAL